MTFDANEEVLSKKRLHEHMPSCGSMKTEHSDEAEKFKQEFWNRAQYTSEHAELYNKLTAE